MSGASSAAFLGSGLALGVVGYRLTEGLGWVDALLEASMILTGMGPVHELHSTAGKLFASAYALFSGVFFLTGTGILLGPLIQRFLHRAHLDIHDDAA